MDARRVEIQENLLTQFARLLVVEGPSPTTESFFRGGVSIGRSQENSVQLLHHTVSMKHAAIERAAGQFCLRDLGSRNGVFVNGKRVTTAILKADDRIALGSARLLFHCAGGVSPVAPPTPVLLIDDRESGSPSVLIAPPPAKPDAASAATERALREVMDLLLELGSIPFDAEPRAFAEKLLRIAMGLVPSDRGVLLALEEGELRPIGVAHTRGDSAASPVVVPRSVIGHALLSRGVVHATDTASDSRFAARDSVHTKGILSLVAIPLMSGPALVGVLYLDSVSRDGCTGSAQAAMLPILGRAIGLVLGMHRPSSDRRTATRAALRRIFPDSGATGHRGSATVVYVAIRTAGESKIDPEAYLVLLDNLFLRAREAIVRCGGEVESTTGPLLKALFRTPDRPDCLEPIQASLQIHREVLGSNLRGRMAGGLQLIARIGIEHGDVAVRALEARPGLASVGEAVTRAAALATKAHRGEILLGPSAWSIWGYQLVMGRSVRLDTAASRTGPEPCAVSMTGFAGERVPADFAPSTAADVMPVRVKQVDGETVVDGLLLASTSLSGGQLRLEAPLLADGTWPAGMLLCLELLLFPFDGKAAFHARILSALAAGPPPPAPAPAPADPDLDLDVTVPPAGFRRAAAPTVVAGDRVTYLLELALPRVCTIEPA